MVLAEDDVAETEEIVLVGSITIEFVTFTQLASADVATVTMSSRSSAAWTRWRTVGVLTGIDVSLVGVDELEP